MKIYSFIASNLPLMVTIASVVCVMDNTFAKTEDSIAYCARNCTAARCNSSGVKADCKARCSDEKVWKIVAGQETSQPQANLYNSQIAKCLDLKTNDVVEQKVPEPQPAFDPKPIREPKPVSDKIKNSPNDLCAAALAAAHEEINQKSMNQAPIHEQNLANLMETHKNNEQNS